MLLPDVPAIPLDLRDVKPTDVADLRELSCEFLERPDRMEFVCFRLGSLAVDWRLTGG